MLFLYLFGAMLLILVILLLIYNNHFILRHYTVETSKIQKEISIALISDLHNKEFGNKQTSILTKIKKIKPDMIVITGDLIDSNKTDIDAAIDLINGALDIAPIYYVSGNHEAWSGSYTFLKSELEKAGVIVLDNEKTEVIKVGDMDSLNQLLKDEQAHVAGISQLEQQRQIEVTDYLRAKGIAPIDSPTVAHVLEYTSSKEEKELLKAARNKLLLTVETLKQQNELNQKLTLQSLQFVNMTLEAIRPKPEQINYSKSEVKGPSNGKTYFDSQA